MLETRKFVMAVLHSKQGLLCDKTFSVLLQRRSLSSFQQTTAKTKSPTALSLTHLNRPNKKFSKRRDFLLIGYYNSSKSIIYCGVLNLELCDVMLAFPKRQILDFSKLKESADDNFKFDENGRKFSKR